MKLAVCYTAAIYLGLVGAVSSFVNARTKFRNVGQCFISTTARSSSLNSREKKIHHDSIRMAMASSENMDKFLQGTMKTVFSAFALATISWTAALPSPAHAVSPDQGASSGANAKILTGGASTLQTGRTIAITRGVNLDNANFGGQNLKGVAFQQSVVRDANFKGSNLVGASFFDATLDGSNFEGADLSLANVEMAQFKRANLKNAVFREAYVSGSTLFEGVRDIEGSDWTDTMLRKDQKAYLCSHPTAKGTNPTTGVGTRESLLCPD